ncbi:MAG: GNAT family N-acetyltransferase [Mucilaginibacter sp.]
MSIVCYTPRITIREYLPDELDTYLDHLFDEKVAPYIPKRTRGERIVIFTNALNHYQTTKAHGMWGMFNNIDGKFIGGCLLRPYHDDPTIFEIGYSIEPKYWGQGLATEMAEALIDYGFANSGIREMVACTVLSNPASQRVLEKVGFKRGENLTEDDGAVLAFFTLSR